FERALANGERVLRMRNPATDPRVDVYMKNGVLGQQLEFIVQNFQTFLGNVVGIDVVDGNLQPLEAGSVQSLNAVRNQQIAVGDQAGDNTVVADAANHVVGLRMRQWFATGVG